MLPQESQSLTSANSTPAANSIPEAQAPITSTVSTAATPAGIPISDLTSNTFGIRNLSDRLLVDGLEISKVGLQTHLRDLNTCLGKLTFIARNYRDPALIVYSAVDKFSERLELPNYEKVIEGARQVLSQKEPDFRQELDHWLARTRAGNLHKLQREDIAELSRVLEGGVKVAKFADYVDKSITAGLVGSTRGEVKFAELLALVNRTAKLTVLHQREPVFQPIFPDYLEAGLINLHSKVGGQNMTNSDFSRRVFLFEHILAAEVGPEHCPTPRVSIESGELRITLPELGKPCSLPLTQTELEFTGLAEIYQGLDRVQSLFDPAQTKGANLMTLARAHDANLASEVGYLAQFCDQRLHWRLEESIPRWLAAFQSPNAQVMDEKMTGQFAQHLQDLFCLLTVASTVRDCIVAKAAVWESERSLKVLPNETNLARTILKNRSELSSLTAQLPADLNYACEFLGFSTDDLTPGADQIFRSRLRPYAYCMAEMSQKDADINAALTGLIQNQA